MKSLVSNQQNHSLTSRSNRPHYYELKLPNGTQRHCGTMRDVECVLSIYPDAVYSKVLLPPVPDTINVPHIIVKDQELPMQQVLPQSDLEPLEL